MPPNPSQRRSSAAPVVALLCLVAWFVTDHYPPWTAFQSELPAVLAGLLAVVGVLRWQARSPLPWPAAALLAAAVLPWLQWATGLVPFAGDAIVASLYLGGSALCFWAGHAADATERDSLLNALAAAMLAGAILTTGVLLYQWFGLRGLNQIYVAEGLPGARNGANLGQANHAATLICLGLAALALARVRVAVGTPVALLAASFLAIGLALTQSRVPWLLAFALAGWALVRREGFGRLWRFAPAGLLGIVTWYALLFWAVGVLPEWLFGVSLADADGSRLGAGRRPVLWGQWFEALRLAPWQGYGWLQGRAAQVAAAPTRPGVEASDYAHSLVLDLLAWNGLPLGLVMLAAGLVWYLRAGFRAEGVQDGFRLVVVTALGVHSLVEYPFAYAYFLVPVALLAGQLAARTQRAGPRLVPRPALALLALAFVAGTAAVVADYVRVEADVRTLREQTARIGGLRRSDAVQGLWVLDQMAAFSRASRIEPAEGMPAAALNDLLMGARRFPNLWLLQQSALALAANGRPDEARRHLDLLCALNGENTHAMVVARMAEAARERLPAARPFVDTLARPAEPAGALTQNRRPACLKR